MTIESERNLEENPFQQLRVANLTHQEIRGVGKKRLDQLIEVENQLAEGGFGGGLPLYLATTDRSLRELEEDLDIGRHALVAVYEHFEIPRPSQEEILRRKSREMWQEPGFREKLVPILTEKLRQLHQDPEIEQRRIESLRDAAQRPEARQRKSEEMIAIWQRPGYRENISQKNREAALRQWRDPISRERIITAVRQATSQRVLTDEFGEKVSQTMKEIWADPEYRERQSASHKAKWEDPEYREEHIEELRQRMARLREDPQVQAKKSESLKRKWEDPEFRARRTEQIREMNKRPDIQARKSAKMKMKWQDPEFRNKQLEILRVVLNDEEIQQRRLAGLHEKWSDPEYREKQAALARERITWLNQNTNQQEKAAEGIRKLRADPDSAGRFHLPTIQGYRKDIDYHAQSAWEANVARVLKCIGREFYAKESFILEVPENYQDLFKFEVSQFTLDFIVQDPRGNLVAYDLIAHPLEDPVGIAKAGMFKEQYPEIPLHVIDEGLYLELKHRFENAINSSPDFCGWETSQDNLYTNPEKYIDQP